MIKCEECGRSEAEGGGHYLGCPAVALAAEGHRLQNLSDEELADEVELCSFPGCTNARWSSDKRAKYCEDHKDPKSRKE